MKFHLPIYLIVLILFTAQLAHSEEPFAPVADIPKGLENSTDPSISMLIMSIKAVKVPIQSTVGIPAYDGAVLIQTNEGTGDFLPSLRLLSADSLSHVFNFYMEELKEWSHDEFMGMYTLWNGDREDSMMGTAPTINIEAAKDDDKKVVPDAQTLISIWYKPVK